MKSTYCVPGTVVGTLNIDYTLHPFNNPIKMGCYYHFQVEETEAQTSGLA